MKTCFLHMPNKGADQLCGKRVADHYIDSTIPLLSKFETLSQSSHLLCLCQIWWETPKTCLPRRKVFSRRGSNIVYRDAVAVDS